MNEDTVIRFYSHDEFQKAAYALVGAEMNKTPIIPTPPESTSQTILNLTKAYVECKSSGVLGKMNLADVIKSKITKLLEQL